MKAKRKILLPIILVISFAFFYFVGYLHGHQNLQYYKGYVPKINNMDLGKPQDVDFSMFWDVWNKVEEKYPTNLLPIKKATKKKGIRPGGKNKK